ncbi:MAG: hypothetical protein K0Q55_3304 [Verrucomicrobia bacterium]|jgi:hypothetical protein|nr:hypothetical protein [Verrucomicrobiota bacterium]
MIPVDVKPLDLESVRVFPLATRKSLTSVEEILLSPEGQPAPASGWNLQLIQRCAADIKRARENGKSVMLIYGAHLLRNGAAQILAQLMQAGWLTHIATNGAGTIHDWEYSWLGRSTENVRDGVATGTFGTWDETSRNIHLALMSGALDGLGYGNSLARFIQEDGTTLPSLAELEAQIRNMPAHSLTAARADLLRMMQKQRYQGGRIAVQHQWKQASILAAAWQHQVPLTVHPGIGYDIITNHPIFSGSAVGRAAELDFKLFSGSVEHLDGGVVLSVGSAIMGPQVFEKSISCVNNLRIQAGRPIVQNHSIYVVDLQEGGSWDWTQGEPPKSNPAYYLRFCKSYARMGGAMHYLCCDNAAFIHHLHHQLKP